MGSRSERLASQRVRERTRYQRVTVVFLLLIVLVLVVPSLSRPTSSADAVLERMVAQERMAAQATALPDPATAPSPEATDGAAAEEPAPQPLPEVVPVTEVGELFVPIGRLEIPKIGLATDVRNGVHDRILETGVGHWPGTQTDNMVFSGHRTTYLHPFRDLDLLQTADQVVYVSGGGAPTTYEVFETRIVTEAEYVDVVLNGTPEPDDRVITMFACHPKGQRTHRIVVRARAVTQVASTVEAPGGV